MRASGETVDAALAQDALTVLNQLIASWDLDSLLVYQIDRQVFTLTANVQSYTVGVGGDFNLTRPVRLEAVNWRDEAQTPALELPLDRMSDAQYQDLRVRSVTASLPTTFYYDQAFPLASIFFWPLPTQTKKVVLFPWLPWSSSNVLTTVVAFPPGYERMLVANLAVELSQQQGARLTQQTATIAEDSKALIASLNAEPPVMASGLPFGRGGGGFNYVSGENR